MGIGVGIGFVDEDGWVLWPWSPLKILMLIDALVVVVAWARVCLWERRG